MAYDLISFDVGETLSTMNPSWEGIYVRACAEFGVKLTAERAKSAIIKEWTASMIATSLAPFEATEEAFWLRQRKIEEAVFDLLEIAQKREQIFQRLQAL